MRKVGIDVRPLAKNPAGIGVYVQGILLGLSESEYPFEYYLFSDRDFDSVTLDPTKFRKVIIPTKSFFWHLLVYFQILKKRIDIYHSTHSLILPILVGSRSILTIHDLSAVLCPETHPIKVRLVFKYLLRLAVRRTGRILVPSHSTQKDLVNEAGAVEERVKVIPHASLSCRATWSKKAEAPYILFIGTIEPRKNLSLLIKSYACLVKEQNIVEDLYIVGGKGWGNENLLEQVRVLNVADRVKFIDYIDTEKKCKLLSEASVFVYPSLFEGFGLPVVEAMDIGVPVVTSNTTSLPEVVGEAALLVDPKSVEDIAGAIHRIIEDKSLAEELSRKGKKQASLYTPRRYISELIKEYKNVVD